MKINFTKREYRTLVEMLLLADWVMHSHDEGPNDAAKPYKDLRKKVLSHHKEMGMGDAFEYAPGSDEYFETRDYEENSPHMRFIDEYEEQSFWEQLSSKLAHRDLAAEEALSTETSLEREQRALRLFQIIGRYEEELAENGLNNLRIDLKTAGPH